MKMEVKGKEYLEKLVDALRQIIIPVEVQEEYGTKEKHTNSYAVASEKSPSETGKRYI